MNFYEKGDNMKLLLGAILIVALLIIGICTVKTYKEKHQIAKTARRVLQIGFAIVFFNIVSLYTTSEAVCLWAYSMYFMASDWLLYYFFKFSLEYIGNRFEEHVKKNYMIALLVADSLSILINNFTEHMYSLNKVVMFGGEVFYELKVGLFFYLHYAIALMLVIFTLISLFYGVFTAAKFYRNKYLLIAVILVVLVIMNIISVTSAIDVSIIGYVVEAICIYYCAFVYTPQKLLPETLFKVAEGMSVGIFLVDVDGKKLYNNKLGAELLDNTSPLLDKNEVTLEQWCMEYYKDSTIEFLEERSFFKEDKEYILRIQLQRMVDENNHLQGAYFIIQDRTEEIEQYKKEQYLATHDTLTGLYNKEYFMKKAEKYINRHPEEKLYIICTDIKDFKMINDFLGTKTGDAVLTDFAKMLDKHMNDFIAYGRLGNDIFGVLMSKDKYREEFFICGSKESFFDGMGNDVSFQIRNYVGVYEIDDRTTPISVMCDRARMAIATIKGDYHKQVAYYSSTMRDNVLYEQELISSLNEAIEQEQLKMYLQPQMSADGKLLGAEALVRWFHPTKGQIMPGKFIPIFEKNGLISDVDLFMWEVACKQLRKWKDEGREDLYISVNISPRDFYFLNIYQIFTELVEKYDIDTKNLKLEITETAIVMDFQRQLELINRLRQGGFIVEMDDFGSGYSSLNMLKDLHVDVLKIDMAFLKKAKDEERSKKILQMIISLSSHLEMPVITEGVETAEQVKFLSEMGCGMFQGYYFAKPMSVDEFEKEYL